MSYEVVFELSDKKFNLLWPPCAAMVVLSVCVIFRKRFRETLDIPKRGSVFVFVGFLLFAISAVGFYVQYCSNYLALFDAYKRGEFFVVEGVVMDFDPMPKEGHKRESFVVNGRKFEYSDHELSPGFNNTTSHGGPIVSALPVRISYVGDFIIKLEIQRVSL